LPNIWTFELIYVIYITTNKKITMCIGVPLDTERGLENCGQV
jgi:hypothetical protein